MVTRVSTHASLCVSVSVFVCGFVCVCVCLCVCASGWGLPVTTAEASTQAEGIELLSPTLRRDIFAGKPRADTDACCRKCQCALHCFRTLFVRYHNKPTQEQSTVEMEQERGQLPRMETSKRREFTRQMRIAKRVPTRKMTTAMWLISSTKAPFQQRTTTQTGTLAHTDQQSNTRKNNPTKLTEEPMDQPTHRQPNKTNQTNTQQQKPRNKPTHTHNHDKCITVKPRQN